MLGDVHAVNTVIDEQRQLCFVNFGEIVESHLDAVRFVHDSCAVPVGRKFRTVVTSSAGYPLDRTYYQTVKGMVTPIDILAPGANLIIASDCSEGWDRRSTAKRSAGSSTTARTDFSRASSTSRWPTLTSGQTEMQLKPMRLAGIHLYSRGLPAEDRPLTGVNVVDSIEDAVARSVDRPAIRRSR